MADPSKTQTPDTSHWWHWIVPAVGVAALVAIVIVRSSNPPRDTGRTSPDRAVDGGSQQTVQLEVDYGNQVTKRFTALPWRDGMTVADALKLAAKRHFGIHYTVEGAGAKTLLTSIDGLQNEGGNQGARNWIYRVNKVPGDRSFAVCRLKPFDTVLWTFSTYE